MLRITTVTGEQAVMSGKRTVNVTMGNSTYVHNFFIGNIQDTCIIELDLLEKWRAIVDVAMGNLHASFGVVTLCGRFLDHCTN